METMERLIFFPVDAALERILAFLPQLAAAFVILTCGVVIGWLLKVALKRLLLWLKFDGSCARLGLTGFAGGESPSLIVARLCGGLTVFAFLLLAIGSLDVKILQGVTERLFIYLPNILIAVLIVVVAFFCGNFCGRAVLIACVNAGNRQARFCSRLVQALILALGIVMALEQLGIGKETVLLAFAISYGGVVLALAIAFGLGGRDLARKVLEKKVQGDEGDGINHL